jgi:N-dimethylarginine dimethylaminohydrolase
MAIHDQSGTHLRKGRSGEKAHLQATPPSTQFARPTFLMCAPSWYRDFSVPRQKSDGQESSDSHAIAFSQWNGLHAALKCLADVKIIHSPEGAGQMTFVARGAAVNFGVAALSCFAELGRSSEEDHLEGWLEREGFIVWKPEGFSLEGEADVLFSPDGNRAWAASGKGASRESHGRLSNIWHVDVASLELIDPRFDHLDACFSPLKSGHVLYYPEAFDRRSLQKIEDAYRREKRIAVSEEEALQYGCNVINVGHHILMHTVGSVAGRLRRAGYLVSTLPLGEFARGGGGAKTLALRLSDLSVTHS